MPEINAVFERTKKKNKEESNTRENNNENFENTPTLYHYDHPL